MIPFWPLVRSSLAAPGVIRMLWLEPSVLAPCFFDRACVGSRNLLSAEPLCSTSTLVPMPTLSVQKNVGREGGDGWIT